jgi:hypothetical protein
MYNNYSNIIYGPREIIASFLPSSERYPDVYGEEYVNEEANKMLKNEFPECINLGSGWEFYEYISNLYYEFLEKDNIFEYILLNFKLEYICIIRSIVKNNEIIFTNFVRNRLNKHNMCLNEKQTTKNFINILYAYSIIHDIINKEKFAKFNIAIRDKTLEIINENFIQNNLKYKNKIIKLYEDIYGKYTY